LARKWITFKLFEAVKDASDEGFRKGVEVLLDRRFEVEAIDGDASAAASLCPQG